MEYRWGFHYYHAKLPLHICYTYNRKSSCRHTTHVLCLYRVCRVQTMSSQSDISVDDDSEQRETSYFIQSKQQNSYRSRLHIRTSVFHVILFAVGIFLSGVISTLSITALKSHAHPYGQYDTGFQEEKLRKWSRIGYAQRWWYLTHFQYSVPSKSIELAQVRFKSPVDFEANGHEFLVTEPSGKSYVGNTTKEVDDAWKDLLWGRYFSISEAEAKKLWGEEYRSFWDHDRSGYTAG